MQAKSTAHKLVAVVSDFTVWKYTLASKAFLSAAVSCYFAQLMQCHLSLIPRPPPPSHCVCRFWQMLFVCVCYEEQDPAYHACCWCCRVMISRNVKYMVVRDRLAAWSESATCFLFSTTGTKNELQEALHARLDHQGHASLFLQDSEGDFMDWDEPIELPTSGTICVKMATGTLPAGNGFGMVICFRYVGLRQKPACVTLSHCFKLRHNFGLISHPVPPVKSGQDVRAWVCS